MARVKRRGKSPPPAAQASGHGKPHRVQGQIGDPGAARSKAQAGSRVSAAQINDPLRRATGEDRTRLTALSRLHYFAGFDGTGLPLRTSMCGVDRRESEHRTPIAGVPDTGPPFLTTTSCHSAKWRAGTSETSHEKHDLHQERRGFRRQDRLALLLRAPARSDIRRWTPRPPSSSWPARARTPSCVGISSSHPRVGR